MNQILLQHCSYQDFPKVIPILEAYSDIFDFHDKRLILQQASKALDEDPEANTLFLALHDGSVIGFLGGRRNTINPLRLDLFCLIIKRGYHNQGIGTQLFNHACQIIKEQGFEQVYVKIKGTYPPHTKDFYKKLGFKPSFDDEYTGSSTEDTSMMLSLEHSPAAQSQTPARTITPAMGD